MKAKKIGTLLLAASMTVGMLGGCGGSGSDASDTAGNVETGNGGAPPEREAKAAR